MRRLLLLIVLSIALIPLISGASAQCIDNGICEPEEKLLGCGDCSFGNVCVDDGKCTSIEFQADCNDCSSAAVAQCIDDGVCSNTESSLGNCNDCQIKAPSTGLVLLAGGIGLLGFIVVFIIAAIVIAFFAFNHFSNRRIRM